MCFVLLSLLVYIAIIIIHLSISRRGMSSKNQVNILLILSLAGAALYWRISSALPLAGQGIWEVPLRSSSLMLYLLLFFPYYIFFTNAEYDSPSQIIMILLNKRGKCSYAELLHEMTPQRLIISRLHDLSNQGFIADHEGKYFLKPKGILLVQFMKIYKIILGREIHG